MASDRHETPESESEAEAWRPPSEDEEHFRAFFNANRDDYMAYWDGNLVLKVANFQLSPEHLKIIQQVRDTGEPAQFEADQNGRTFDYKAYPALNAFGECQGIAVYAHDISARKAAESEVNRLAYFDSLTGLPNRVQLSLRLSQAVKSAQRHNHLGALLFIDLDRFKYVNDSLGHSVGDEVLKAVAQRLEYCRRGEDMVARMGGDEFVWVLPDLGRDIEKAATDATRAAERLIEDFVTTLRAGDHELRMTPSIGIAIFGDDQEGVSEILKQADSAMHRAKRAGSGCVRIYRPQMQEAAMERLKLEIKLHEAVDNETLELHFQPQASVHDDEIVGVETLLRWTDDELGSIPPSKFIPIAEETGMILKIGDWMLGAVCRQIREWNDHPIGSPVPRVAVNISPVQFRQPDFVENVRTAIETWGIPPEQLELELTEGIVIEQVDNTIKKMNELREIGVRFAIDDFGTGYSSLAYLNKLPLDILKIDQSFVRGMGEIDSSTSIVTSIITMAHLLGFDLIAEGVETDDQLALLREQGCQTYQGYRYSRPLKVDDLNEFLSGGGQRQAG